MQDNMGKTVREIFPAVFDSEGRPWETQSLDEAFEFLLKSTALTQHSVAMPVGYIFDHPTLHHIFFRHAGDEPDSVAFRQLMADHLQVAIEGGASDDVTSKEEGWRELYSNWAGGTDTRRGELVYANFLGLGVQQTAGVTTASDLLAICDQYAVQQSRSRFSKLFRNLASIAPEPIPYSKFSFDPILRTQLSTWTESFGIDRRLVEKIEGIGANLPEGVRFSRSLLHKPTKCIDLGIPPRFTLNEREYSTILPALNAAHHEAFSAALGRAAIYTTSPPPFTGEPLADSLRAEFARLAQAEHVWPLTWPLESLTYEDIVKVRIKNRSAFLGSLKHISDAFKFGSPEQYKQAIIGHSKFCSSIIGLRPLLSASTWEAVGSALRPGMSISSVYELGKLAMLVGFDAKRRRKAGKTLRTFFEGRFAPASAALQERVPAALPSGHPFREER